MPDADGGPVTTLDLVREWIMSGDEEVAQWERDFAAAIDARTAPLRHALAQLVMMARTSAGTAGPDPQLMQACAEAEAVLAGQEPAAAGGVRPVLHVQFSDDGAYIRRWSAAPFAGATVYRVLGPSCEDVR